MVPRIENNLNAEGATSIAALDPTLQTLLTIFGGALVAALAGLIGWFLQGSREHKRWLRERRYEAYLRAYALLKAFDLNATKQYKIAELRTERRLSPADKERMSELQREADLLYNKVAEELAPVIVSGPARVTRLAIDIQTAYEAHNKDAQASAERQFLMAAQRAVRVAGADRVDGNPSAPSRTILVIRLVISVVVLAAMAYLVTGVAIAGTKIPFDESDTNLVLGASSLLLASLRFIWVALHRYETSTAFACAIVSAVIPFGVTYSAAFAPSWLPLWSMLGLLAIAAAAFVYGSILDIRRVGRSSWFWATPSWT